MQIFSLLESIPDYWCEAKKRWPWLPETTKQMHYGWRNRTRAENALIRAIEGPDEEKS